MKTVVGIPCHYSHFTDEDSKAQIGRWFGEESSTNETNGIRRDRRNVKVNLTFKEIRSQFGNNPRSLKKSLGFKFRGVNPTLKKLGSNFFCHSNSTKKGHQNINISKYTKYSTGVTWWRFFKLVHCLTFLINKDRRKILCNSTGLICVSCKGANLQERTPTSTQIQT